MKSSGARRKTQPPAPHQKATRANKTDYLMVRISPENKAEIETRASADDEAVAAWCRTRLLKLARGWKLVPPEE